MKIYLVQHGEALAKDVDPDRSLSLAGRSDVEQLAVFLTAHIDVSRIIHSGKMRAQQTAEIITESLKSETFIEVFNGINPNDPVEAFAQQLDDWNEDMLVVGHLPFMHRLVAYLLTGSAAESIVSYVPGSIVCLVSNGDEGWRLQWMMRPELVRK